jgi:tRNA-modifying protein YgfZ
MTGYEALRESAALLDLSARGRIVVKGEDRKRLLHAMSTNHIEELTPGRGAYVFFLTAQGRILADAVVLCREQDLLLLLEAESREKVYQHLDRYIIADDVTLHDATEELCEIGVEGPGAADWLRAQGAPVPDVPFTWADWEDAVVARVSATGSQGWRLIAPVGRRESLISLLAVATEEESEMVRHEIGHPRYGKDISDANLVQETGQMHAVSFNKGCYLGQEIVERVRSRGQVNRLLTSLRIGLPAAPAAGAKVLLGEKSVGEVTSASMSPAEGSVRALGYIRAEALKGGGELSVEGGRAEVVKHA